jgi:L-alanine-DL-glutamate epimerase-like enolase superfamily enzyme
MTTVESLAVAAYTVPCDAPESDGTFEWDATTIVVVEVRSGSNTGIGYTYGPAALCALVDGTLSPAVRGRDVFDVGGTWSAMVRAVRNMGPWGLAMYAVSAVDVALWDLKARLLDVPLATLLGRRRESVETYGSGGFCTYEDARLRAQLHGWVADGFARVKIKVGRDDAADLHRVAVAREEIGPAVELMVDANGAWSPARAVAMAHRLEGIGWLEEPVSSDDLDGLRHVRSRVPPGVSVAAGEYATDSFTFERLVDVVDVLQADVTRCGGITGFLRAGALAAAHNRDLSAHCAPNLSVHPMTAVERARHIEFFHDHARIEALLFDGALDPAGGTLVPDPQRAGHGLELRRSVAARYAS